MKARIKKLKDVDKTDILPVTHAKAVYVNNDSTLDKALEHIKSDIENIDLSAEKVNLNSTNLKSKTVKEGMEELFTFADNGKKNWVDVVGSPLSTGDSFSTLKSKTQTLKNTFASNLTSKQQPSNSNESLNNLINKVANISIGKKFATATRTIEPTESQTLIEIRGLSFTPSKVIVFADINSSWGKLLETLILSNDYNSSIYEVCTVSCTTGTRTGAAHYTTNYIVDKGFDVDMQHLFCDARYGGELRYWAFE
ncbi:hypothetical protein [Clostridium rectalis]|uniref:hypothetical protein n=1 Tax=Clostridium rectalis TaxID=2040295 RepID=UPI000F638580|nr:hypothetical protein [Clostridium rectalis]